MGSQVKANPRSGTYLDGDANLLSSTDGSCPGYGDPGAAKLFCHTYGVILKHNSELLARRNVLDNMHRIMKLISPTSAWNMMLRDMQSNKIFLLINDYECCPMVRTN